jgi:hypothetical protein
MNTVTTNILIISGIFTAVLIFTIILAIRRTRKMYYAIEVGGAKRLEIIVKGRWKEIEVWFDGSVAGIITGKELSSGHDLKISDGSILNLKLVKLIFQPERIKITRNGQPLPRVFTENDNQAVINNSANVVYFIAFMNLAIGIVSIFTKIEIFAPFGFGWQNIAFGFVFLVLGIFAHRRSALALILAVIIFGLDSIIGIILAFWAGAYLIIGQLLFRITLLAPMFYGIGAIYGHKRKAESKFFTYLATALIISVIIGGCGIVAWAIFNIMNIGKQPALTLPKFGQQPAPLSLTLMVKSEGSCHLKIKDTAEFVNMRDKADNSVGKIVDYLDKQDVAIVLGNDGGSPGSDWWFIEVTHKGKTNQGWVISKWVELDNIQSCSKTLQIATPFP